MTAFLHVCEVCGLETLLASEKAYQAGWDYPPRMGTFGVISPRTCGSCNMAETLWWAIQQGELDTSDPLGWPEGRRQTLARILSEKPPETDTLTDLDETAEPGIYEVTTATGSVYEVVLDHDRPTTIARKSEQEALYGGDQAMVVDAISFTVGESGRYRFKKAEGDAPDIGDLEYAATFRETSLVVSIRKVAVGGS